MNEGWWVNYRTKRYVELKCRYVDHEMTLRNEQNQDWLGIPASVVKGFAQFQPRTDRDAMLLYAMGKCPLMRIRGHGGMFTTVEFHSNDRRRVLVAIRRWAKRFAAPTTILNVSNLVTRKTVRLTVAELNRHTMEECAILSVFQHPRGNVLSEQQED